MIKSTQFHEVIVKGSAWRAVPEALRPPDDAPLEHVTAVEAHAQPVCSAARRTAHGAGGHGCGAGAVLPFSRFSAVTPIGVAGPGNPPGDLRGGAEARPRAVARTKKELRVV